MHSASHARRLGPPRAIAIALPRQRTRTLARWALATAAALAATAAFASVARGQSSSLFGEPDPRRDLTLDRLSWTYQRPLEKQPLRVHDVITVLVSEESVFISEGQMDRKKKAYGDFKLPDWILFKGLSVVPDPQSAGEPHIRGEVDNKLRSQANLETRDSLEFKMACMVVDVRPNGVLVIEGHRTIQNNAEIWDYSLTGEIRDKDVLPNNTVKSENVAHLSLLKRKQGHVRDGYRRGWLLKWLDKYQPF